MTTTRFHKMPPAKTPPPKKRKQYADEDMQNAILAVRSGVETTSSAAKRFGVPRVTLLDKINGRYEEKCKLGRKPLLSDVEEEVLVQWVLACKTKGFPVTKEQLIFSAGRMLAKSGKPNPFVNQKPGRRWYELFMGRHKNLAVRECQTLTTSRAAITQESVASWCAEVKTYCQENDLMDIFQDLRRVFNCDETAFFLSPKTGKVIAARGDRSVYNISGNTDKENVTVLMTVRADGEVAPPMILYAYERIPLQVGMAVPDGWGLGKSESGWMTSEAFFEYMANTFEPYLTANNIPRPVIMFMDGHVSHLSLELSEFCTSKKIELVALLPNATHLLQPLDVAVFHPLKNAWKKAVSQWRFDHSSQKLKKEDFPPMLQSVIERTIKPETIQNGFKTCGLVTLDVNDIDMTKIVGNLAQNPKPLTQQSNVETERVNICLAHLEKKIGHDRLKAFRHGGPIKRRDESLYEVWRSIRQDLKTSIDQSNCSDSNKTTNSVEEHRPLDFVNSTRMDMEEVVCNDPDDPDDPDPMMPTTIQQEPNVLIDCSSNIELEEEIFVDEGLFEDLGLDVSMGLELDLPVTVVSEPVQQIPANIGSTPPVTCARAVTPTSRPSTSVQEDAQPSTSAVQEDTSSIPSPFKDCVFWPGPKKESGIKRRTKTAKVPSVITCIKWKEYRKTLVAEKEKKEKEMEERRQKRREKQEMKKVAMKIKKEKVSGPRKKTEKEDVSPLSSDSEDLGLDVSMAPSAFNIDKVPVNPKLCFEDFSVGKWVIVPYGTKRYIGQLLDVNGEEKTGNIQFLAQVGDTFVWPENDDVDDVPLDEIVTILSEPIFDRRGHYRFQL